MNVRFNLVRSNVARFNLVIAIAVLALFSFIITPLTVQAGVPAQPPANPYTPNPACGNYTLYGTMLDDNDVVMPRLVGLPDHNNTIEGRKGNDLIWGGLCNDFIRGGEDDDTIFAFDGDDVVQAGAGNDIIWAGPGADHLVGGPGDNDICYGEGGLDTFNDSCEVQIQ